MLHVEVFYNQAEGAPHGHSICLFMEFIIPLKIAGHLAVLEKGLDVFWKNLLDECQSVLYRYLSEQVPICQS